VIAWTTIQYAARYAATLQYAARYAAANAQALVRAAEKHSGVPAILLVALVLVLSWRLVKKLSRLLVEVCVAAILVFTLTELGVIRF
jgi:hypothetical protein